MKGKALIIIVGGSGRLKDITVDSVLKERSMYQEDKFEFHALPSKLN